MRYVALFLIITITLASCQKNKKKYDVRDYLKKSYKEQKDSNLLTKFTEHLDSVNNIYTNYKYHVAFDAPNHWSSDKGISEHTIFRTFQADSAITFFINVIESKAPKNVKEPDAWELYKVHKKEMDYPIKVLIPKQFSTTIKDFKASKTFIKNKTALKREGSYLVRELDVEYRNTFMIYTVLINNLTYTFGLDVPTVFYEENRMFYDNLVSGISFVYGVDDYNYYINDTQN
tara:strand:+ start:1107 stop:1799 length:693 start_codon:yes stop_codon:yes gene_type:complete